MVRRHLFREPPDSEWFPAQGARLFVIKERGGCSAATPTDQVFIIPSQRGPPVWYRIRAVDAAGNRTALTRYVVGEAIAGSL